MVVYGETMGLMRYLFMLQDTTGKNMTANKIKITACKAVDFTFTSNVYCIPAAIVLHT